MNKKMLIISGILMIVAGFFVWNQVSSSQENDIFNLSEVEMISIDTEEWDVNLVETNSQQIKVSAENLNHGDGAKAKLVDGTLKIQQGTSKNGLFGGFSFKNNSQLTVEIPVNNYKNYQVTTQSGDISLNRVNLAKSKIESSTGDIYLNKISAHENASIETKNGEIDLSFKTKPTDLKLKTSAEFLDTEQDLNDFNSGKQQLDLRCPDGTMTIY
ncbi:DUF4097 family beta strand repeat-containing protein [Enterococcus sp. AZ103]|uniref:DUF4097 family beta strand repeat-containing protein n=1 Tax=Enterococcus sp. AZ103 TaxID=2774628 RepID=UPI003F26AEE4